MNYVYDETFRQWRLPLLLSLLTTHLVLYAVVVAHGRWRRPTRWLDMILSVAISGLLVWSVAAGRIFEGEVGNSVVRGVVVLTVLVVVWNAAVTLYRESVRVRRAG